MGVENFSSNAGVYYNGAQVFLNCTGEYYSFQLNYYYNCFQITVGPHLVDLHLIISNVAHIASRTNLGADHPIRRVLKIFLYNTGHINRQAYFTLTQENMILHRMTGLTYDSLIAGLKISTEKFIYLTYPEYLDAKKLDDTIKARIPCYTDALPIWDAFHRYIFIF